MATSPLYHHIIHRMLYLFPLLFLALTVQAQVRRQFRRPQSTQTNAVDNSTVSNTNITAFTATLPVDHNGTTTEIFENRYWVDDSYWVEGGPIMLFDVGEVDADTVLPYLNLSHQTAQARANSGLLILWEHRYYGRSLPALPATVLPDDLNAYYKFHTIEQALEDVAVFARTFTWGSATVSPGLVPWVFVGGSYPGARAAWARKRNPEIWYAALASSAVVHEAPENQYYYQAILNGLREHGYGACADDMVAMAAWVERADDAAVIDWLVALSNTSEAATEFFDPSSISAPLTDYVTGALGIPLTEYQDYAFQNGTGGRGDLADFCGLMAQLSADAGAEGGVFDSALSEAEAVAPYVSAAGLVLKRRLDLTAGSTVSKRDLTHININMFKRQVTNSTGGGGGGGGGGETVSTCAENAEECMQFLDSNSISWTYQVCTDFANTVTVPETGGGLYPHRFIGLEALYDHRCKGNFNLTAMPGSDNNERYGGWAMQSSNTFFVDGQYDPWRPATVNSQAPEAHGRRRTEEVPAAGEVLKGGVFAMVIEGGAHCPDLGGGWNRSGKPAFDLWNKALSVWLPAFQVHEVSNVTAGTGAGWSRS
ncbi:uncharacterized protein H6S33_006941 [Morchella sextelata]|uniref:uncharacterized protein n=1 Tax=Morchella sextelata TaxID=1174677 RepID=UPI001D055289|nr:uncharacterized protein H6S33_006941 [Morchella sextelata]KAH0604564.1 hypothetical protein H6S33_006941 [Morchella sextelata]